MNLDKAYKNFFRDKSVGFPKFKSKKNPVQSYTTNNQNGSGKYFISLMCETDIEELPETNSAVGIDLGIKDMAILSTGEKVKTIKNKELK